jgi:hypothetical protein
MSSSRVAAVGERKGWPRWEPAPKENTGSDWGEKQKKRSSVWRGASNWQDWLMSRLRARRMQKTPDHDARAMEHRRFEKFRFSARC